MKGYYGEKNYLDMFFEGLIICSGIERGIFRKSNICDNYCIARMKLEI